MIGKLSGVIDYRADDHVLLDVRGVGYIIFCSDRTLAALPRSGAAAALYTDLIVREDLLQLFDTDNFQDKKSLKDGTKIIPFVTCNIVPPQ